MKAFLGLTQWYSIYIPGYAKYSASLNDALRGLAITKAQKRDRKMAASGRERVETLKKRQLRDDPPGTGKRKKRNFRFFLEVGQVPAGQALGRPRAEPCPGGHRPGVSRVTRYRSGAPFLEGQIVVQGP